MNAFTHVLLVECCKGPQGIHWQGHASRSWLLSYRIQTRTVSDFIIKEYSVYFSVQVKYIALQAMAKIAPTHPHLIADYQDTIMASVNDQDISIRMRALELVSTMASILLIQRTVLIMSRWIAAIYSQLFSNSFLIS
jgi:hypothetical protein